MSGVRSSRLMREVNVDLSSLCGEYDTSHSIGFFRECAAPSCSSVVWMTGATFAAYAAHAEKGWIVVTGHSGPEPPLAGTSGNRATLRRHGVLGPQPAKVPRTRCLLTTRSLE